MGLSTLGIPWVVAPSSRSVAFSSVPARTHRWTPICFVLILLNIGRLADGSGYGYCAVTIQDNMRVYGLLAGFLCVSFGLTRVSWAF